MTSPFQLGTHVATVRTVASPGQVLGAFIYVLPNGFPRVGVNMIAAQSAVETLHWNSMHNWNAGNTTPSLAQLKKGIAWMDQGFVGQMQYISYPSLIAGCAGMVSFIKAYGAIPYAQNGDLPGYMGRLQARCYLGCVGNVDPTTNRPIPAYSYVAYQAGIASYMAKLANVTPEIPAWWNFLTPLDWTFTAAGVVGVAALSLALIRRPGSL